MYSLICVVGPPTDYGKKSNEEDAIGKQVAGAQRLSGQGGNGTTALPVSFQRLSGSASRVNYHGLIWV